MSQDRRTILKTLSGASVGTVAGCIGAVSASARVDSSKPSAELDREPEPEMGLVRELVGADAETNAHFGSAVALSADATTAVVGAYDQNNADESGVFDRTGAVYIFEKSDGSWSQQEQFRPDDSEVRSMGYEVAMSSDGTTAITRLSYGGRGTARVFEKSGDSWSRQTELTPPEFSERNSFATSLAVSRDGSMALIGDTTSVETESGSEPGAVYVFEQSAGSWSHQHTLHASEADSFGRSVALSGDNTTVIAAGYISAYVFNRSADSWSRETSLETNSDYDIASVAVSTDGSIAAVSSHIFGFSDDVDPTHVFERSGESWAQQAKLVPDAVGAGDRTNTTVTMSADGSTVVCSARGMSTSEGDIPGAAYIFDRFDESWSQRESILGNEEGRGFGQSMAITPTAETMIVGDRNQQTNNGRSGAAYVYVAEEPNTGPTAAFNLSPTAPAVGDTVTFDASSSTVPNSQITSYEWDFTGNGTVDASGETVQYTYQTVGKYNVELTVTDGNDKIGTATKTISVVDDDSGNSSLSRFDTNNNGEIDFSEVIDAIAAHNSGTQIGGKDVGFQDVIAVIRAHNSTPTDTFTDPNSWSSSGPDTHDVSPRDDGIEFSYDYSGVPASSQTWEYETTVETDGTLEVSWQYDGNHSWYRADADAYIEVNRDRTQLTDTGGDGQFSESGVTEISVNSGDTVRVVLEGYHFDRSEIMQGSFSITEVYQS